MTTIWTLLGSILPLIIKGWFTARGRKAITEKQMVRLSNRLKRNARQDVITNKKIEALELKLAELTTEERADLEEEQRS